MPVLVKYSATYGEDLFLYLFLISTLIKFSSKLRLESRMIPIWFWGVVWLTVLLLKVKGRWFIFLVYLPWSYNIKFMFLLKISSWTCLLGSGLKLIFHWYAELLIFTRHNSTHFSWCCFHGLGKMMMYCHQII